MQIRLWGIPEENKYILELLQRELKDKIKIISSAYQSKNNNTQRIYIEIDLENRNYRNHPAKNNNYQFKEDAFFEEIKNGVEQNQ